jgi:hypothetical protein
MNLKKVNSSMVYAIGYDSKSKALEVIFTSGKAWVYEEVPKKVYQELLKSESVGSYMRENVIDCYSSYPVRLSR